MQDNTFIFLGRSGHEEANSLQSCTLSLKTASGIVSALESPLEFKSGHARRRDGVVLGSDYGRGHF